MTTRPAKARHWRVGELAAAAGLSVRTLRHYERLGLLAPASRTRGRQRLFDEHALGRLCRIRALRDLGFSLADIRRLLDDDRAGLAESLRAQQARLERELQRLERRRMLLKHACAHAEGDLLATIEALSRVSRHGDARRERGHAEADVEDRWRALGGELRTCMSAGEPPTSPRARAAARTAQRWLAEFADGDAAVLAALAELRRSAPPENLAGWDPALMRYLDQALASLHDTGGPLC